LRDRLSAWGVTRLDRVFPWFKHEDVHAQNRLGEPVQLEDLADFYFAHVTPGTDVGGLVRQMAIAPEILHASLDYGGPAAAFTPNDPDFWKQWGLNQTGQVLCGWQAQANDIRADPAWDMTTGSPSVRVAVLDTGIDTTHIELAGRARGGPAFVQPPVATSYDDDNHVPGRHGTAVTGILAATGNNSNRIAGVGWGIVPWAVKVVRSSDYFSRASWVGQGIDWARANSIPIVSMSLAFPEAACIGGGTPIPPDSAQIMNAACLNAFYAGQFLVASSGNCNVPIEQWLRSSGGSTRWEPSSSTGSTGKTSISIPTYVVSRSSARVPLQDPGSMLLPPGATSL
jgi:subtilisin family serine protease